MKKLFLFVLLMSICSGIFYSCKKDTGGGSGTPSLTISLSKSIVSLANPENVTVTVKDENNTDVTTSCTIKVNGVTMSGSIYTPTTSGSFDFIATKGSLTSNTANLVVNATTTTGSDSLYVVFSKDTVEFNEFDECSFSVFDKFTNADVTSSARIFVNSKGLVGTSWIAPALQNVPVFATLGTKFSKVKTCYVRAATPSPFTRKLLVEDYTGTWCGWCPRVAYALENYITAKPNTVVVAVHSGSSSDPFQFQYANNLCSSFGISSWPTAMVNRYKKWDEANATLDAEFNRWAPLGLAIESSVNGTTITGKAKVKFNVSTPKSMKIVVALVENGLIYDQTNYTTLYNGANPVVGFVHNNVMRKCATDIFGDAIPTTQQVKDNIYEFNFSMTTSGITDPSKCSIVAYVVDATTAKKGVYNVQRADVGTIKNFD